MNQHCFGGLDRYPEKPEWARAKAGENVFPVLSPRGVAIRYIKISTKAATNIFVKGEQQTTEKDPEGQYNGQGTWFTTEAAGTTSRQDGERGIIESVIFEDDADYFAEFYF